LEDLSPLAHPLAQKKLVKKLNKIIKKGMSRLDITTWIIKIKFITASKARQVKRGVKEVVKGIRKGEKGHVLFTYEMTIYNWHIAGFWS
jgi:H/ACA ribonucleoprotein complex subunit 2